MKKAQTDPMSKFWADTFTTDTIIDWDIFINSLTSFIDKHYRVRLQELQKNQIKRIVDPSKMQQIKVKNFNEFIEDYWILPINREKLFKKHFKPIDMEYQNQLKCIDIKIVARQNGKEKQINYNFKNDSLRQANISHPLKNKGFVNIGSSELADVTINNIYINPTHLKIFRHPLGYKFKDISKSNRVLISFNKPLLLRSGMVIRLFNYELTVISLLANPINPDPSFLQVYINEDNTHDTVNDSTLNFTLKDNRNQENKQYTINYKKQFRIGKDMSCDAVLNDLRSDLLACQLVYNRQNWFLSPRHPIGVYMANRREIDKCLDSVSMFLSEPTKLQFRETVVQLKPVRN